MNLEEYLFKNGINKTEFAKKLNVQRHHFYSVLAGRFKVSKKLADNVESITNGEVKRHEILKYNKEKIDA